MILVTSDGKTDIIRKPRWTIGTGVDTVVGDSVPAGAVVADTSGN